MSAIACLREAAGILDETDVTIEYADVEPADLITPPNSRVAQFKQNLERLRQENAPYKPEHNYSHYQAKKNYAQAKDVGRYFWRNYEEFTTVHIVRTADENTAPLVEQTEALTPELYDQSRRGLLNRLSGDSARVEVLAPKYPTRPNVRVRTHVHEGYWIPGHHDAERFELLRDKHHEKVPGATSVSISVEHHSADDGPTVVQGKDHARGGTSRLPHELAGANQPLMRVETDALDLHDSRVLEWMAALSAGLEGTQKTRGMSYWRGCNTFSKYAETIENTMRRQAYRDLKRSKLPSQIQEPESNVMPELDEPESQPLKRPETS
ncbi:uncharacterized protein HHUB_3120 [Halobacterium hubeiense]|uniref:Uncharacterized protein n=1 Tax=Halobacterium hubeiense TaxID=1407499 RepID=A0A0U5H426_9EURY|nr:hypothetical protein [Halobacterium hubeiense]CQH60038.1 uncharacterized protein HHUB_3120 [Halobacterium hubeiense]